MSWLVILAIPLSFLFHNILHEFAHGIVGLITSGTKFKIWPFPGYLDGKWTWAHVIFDKPITGRKSKLAVFSAPIFAEQAWALLIILVGSAFLPKWLILLELMACAIDVSNWFYGYWNPNMNHDCDAEKVRAELGFSRQSGRIYGLLIVASFAVAISSIIANF